VTERAIRLARQLDAELGRMARFVSGLTPDQVGAACADPQGDTVSGVLSHLREGTEQVVRWAARMADGGAAGHPVGVHGHAHGDGHPHGDGQAHAAGGGAPGAARDPGEGPDPQEEIDRTVAVLSQGGDLVVLAVTGLSDAQLDVVPPATPGLADGVMTLQRIIEFIGEDLAAHLEHLQAAVGASSTVAR
jgi:DinB superfamily